MPAAQVALHQPTFTPQLTTIDWAQEWQNLQVARKASDDPAFWNERSKTYNCGRRTSPYAHQFIELAEIQPEETVFDMGCGTGALSIPLGLAGHSVIAGDFSEGMLGVLQRDCANLGITTVQTKVMSWEDDWVAHGVLPNSVDVAVASRSIATADMRDSLERLTSVARRRACITLPTGSSPRTDERILSAIGIQDQLGRDFLYAFMILVQMGYQPEVRYIPSERHDTYASFDEAFENLTKMVYDAAEAMLSEAETARALENLKTWLTDNLIDNPEQGRADASGEPQKAYMLKKPRIVTWAHISWNK